MVFPSRSVLDKDSRSVWACDPRSRSNAALGRRCLVTAFNSTQLLTPSVVPECTTDFGSIPDPVFEGINPGLQIKKKSLKITL